MIIPVLMYHSISDDGSSLSVSPNKFLEQMEYLSKSGYNSINFNQIYKENKKPIIITFDDGYKDNLINALPILKKYNLYFLPELRSRVTFILCRRMAKIPIIGRIKL